MEYQEQCGSCWTCLTTSIATEVTVDSACTDELMNNGFVLAAKNAICTEANYCYTCLATKGTCKAPLMEVSRGTEAYPQTASRL